LAFTRNPAVGFPATYTGTNEIDALVLIDQASQVTINGLDANDSVIVLGSALQNPALSNFTIYGNNGNDAITVSQIQTFSSSLIQGGSGTDSISVTGLVVGSTIRGGADGDRIFVSSLSSSTVNGNKGDDFLSISNFAVLSNARVFGGSENDEIEVRGQIRNSSVNGSAGADLIQIFGSMVNSTAFGGSGNDKLEVFTASDVAVSGDLGNDFVQVTFSGDGDNVIETGDGNDRVDIDFGADGFNTIDTSVGADTINLFTLFGTNSIIFDRGDSVVSTSDTLLATVADGTSITFGNGVDLITGFDFLTDEVAVDFGVTVFDNLNLDATTDILASTGVYEVRGTIAGNTFNVLAAGTDYLYIVGGANQTIANALASSSNIFFSDEQLFAGNFV
jgi:hypothetical protein